MQPNRNLVVYMNKTRPFTQALDRLRDAGLRPTRQRMALAKLLFEGPDRHVTAEMLHGEASNARMRVSLATVYNTLHQFTKVGLMREIVVDSGRSYFDTNMADHYHFFNEGSKELYDISKDELDMTLIAAAPAGMKVEKVDVIVRISEK